MDYILFYFDLCLIVSRDSSKITFFHIYDSYYHTTMHPIQLVNQSFQRGITYTRTYWHLWPDTSPPLSSSSISVKWVKDGITCHSSRGPWVSEGWCNQMFLQQGFFSSVFSVWELFKDTALIEPRTTSLLLTFLWISEARNWHILCN